jgi:outer membrane assembly lipoprotein YfiO
VLKYQSVADQNPGTLLGSFAYLRIAEIHAIQEEWVQADTNYRLFLNANQGSHLTPFVLYRLARVNHLSSYTGLFSRTRDYDRDMKPNRQMIEEYKRFYFLYPESIFLPEVRSFAQAARESLAEYERLVGDYYYDRELYNAAAGRYEYLLLHYPGYPDSDAVVERLVETYRRNQEPGKAAELERLGGGLGPDRAPDAVSAQDDGRDAAIAAGAAPQ